MYYSIVYTVMPACQQLNNKERISHEQEGYNIYTT